MDYYRWKILLLVLFSLPGPLNSAVQSNLAFTIVLINNIPERLITSSPPLSSSPSDPIRYLAVDDGSCLKSLSRTSIFLDNYEYSSDVAALECHPNSFIEIWNSQSKRTYKTPFLSDDTLVSIEEDGFFILSSQKYDHDTYSDEKVLHLLEEDYLLSHYFAKNQIFKLWRCIQKNGLKSFVIGKFIDTTKAKKFTHVDGESISVMQLMFAHGIDQGFKVNSDGRIKIADIGTHTIFQIASDIGSAQLQIEQEKLLVKHTGDAWIIVLRPEDSNDQNMCDREVYPESITMSSSNDGNFQLPANPSGSFLTIENGGIFVILVPMSTKDLIEIPSVYLKGMLSSIYANDKIGLKVITDSFVQKIIKDAKIAFIIGKFVPSPVKIFAKARKYVLDCMKIWQMNETTSTKLEPITHEIGFHIKNGSSGATVRILCENEKIRLVYSQYGLANVLVYRPKKGLIFPDPQVFINANDDDDDDDDEYTAWENIHPSMISDEFQIGDLIMVFIPLNEDAAEELSPQVLHDILMLYVLTGNTELLSEDVFCSIHRITSIE